MMDIIFRGKRVDGTGWAYGLPSYLDGATDKTIGTIEVVNQMENENGDTWYASDFFDIDPKTLGQFTGLKDKNGNMIFEGDFVSNDAIKPFGKATVSYCKRIAGFSVGTNEDPLCLLSMEYTSICGNIYDN